MKEGKERVPVPVELSATVLFKAHRTCCVCRNERLPVQLHHIDDDPSNNEEENLAVLCPVCHDDTQLKGGFGRKLDAAQVRLYKFDWEAAVASGRSVRVDRTSMASQIVGQFQIRASFTEAFIVGGGVKSLGRQVSADITNIGEGTRFLDVLGLKIEPSSGSPRYVQLHFIGALAHIKKRMESGEKQSFSVALSDLTNSPFHDGLKPGEVFSLFARDTIGKMHYSDTIKYEL